MGNLDKQQRNAHNNLDLVKIVATFSARFVFIEHNRGFSTENWADQIKNQLKISTYGKVKLKKKEMVKRIVDFSFMFHFSVRSFYVK